MINFLKENKQIIKSDKIKYKVYFSKDFHDSIIFDFETLLKSEYFFSYKPSGISNLVEYTDVSYFYAELNKRSNTLLDNRKFVNEFYFKNNKKWPWQLKK